MGNSMTKSELLAELYGRLPTFRERDCMDTAGVIIDTMSQTLVEGGRIEIRGFGSFGLKYRPERVGRNPQDGSAVAVRLVEGGRIAVSYTHLTLPTTTLV